MKKCPFCKAEIEENARFCLYCMTSLEGKEEIIISKKKNRRWLVILAAVLVLFLLSGSVWIFANMEKAPSSNPDKNLYPQIQSPSEDKSTDLEQDNNTAENDSSQTTNTTEEENPSSQSIQQDDTEKNNENNNNNNKNNTKNKNNNKKPNTNNTYTGITDNTDNTDIDTSKQEDTPTPPSDSTDNTIPDESTTVVAKYTYAEATIENTYPTGYGYAHAPDDAIVITKVNYKEESGNYVIPDTIDGKRVTAIMPFAFCDPSVSPTVKSVTLPTTVKTLWSNAFKDCYNLKDIYIKSGTIGIYSNAFPETVKRNYTITFHCAKDCKDYEFYYYSNIAYQYDAKYEEWNG